MLEGAAARLKTRLERPLHGKQFSEVKDRNGSIAALRCSRQQPFDQVGVVVRRRSARR
jgi:hypothetical protein